MIQKKKPEAKVQVFQGNIPELEDLPKLAQLRLMIHHRLRECHKRKLTWKAVALRSGVSYATVNRAAYNVNHRTTAGTLFRLAPVLGIDLTATYNERW